MVRFRGRCPFKQYVHKKPGKYGIKIWAACDARSGYAWNMQVYTGKPAFGHSEKNKGKRVVLDMTSGLQGHIITCNPSFTSYALGEELLKKKLTMIGPVKANKAELPYALLSSNNRAQCSSMFAFTNTHTVVSYYSYRKNVLLMSTHHKDATISISEDKKPNIILDCDWTKGGVDILDKALGTYSCKSSTSRWSMALFYNMLDVSAYNSFVVWTEMNPSWNRGKGIRRRLFLEELGNALVFPLMERRQHVPRTPASLSVLREAQKRDSTCPLIAPNPNKRKRCQVCLPRDKRTSTMCQKCNIYICKEHTVITVYCHVCSKA